MASTISSRDRFKEISFTQTIATESGDNDIYSGPCTLYSIDCTNLMAADVFYKAYDATSATYADRPLIAWKLAASTRRTIYFGAGLRFATGLTIRCTDDALKHTGQDGATPSSNNQMIIHAKEG